MTSDKSRPLAETLFRFSSDHYEENQIQETDLIQLTPWGISLTHDPSRPTLLLKDSKGDHVLPVALNPLEAGATLSQSNQRAMPTTPHKVTQLLLESLSIKIIRCVFVEIKGAFQYVRLYFEGHPTHGSLKVKADEAMSLCLHLNVPIYATDVFMKKSRKLNSDLEAIHTGFQMNPAFLNKPHEYMQ